MPKRCERRIVVSANRSRLLTRHEKKLRLSAWRELRQQPFDIKSPGTPDPDIFDLVDNLNKRRGLCTVQSCAGHRDHVGVVRPGHLWLRLSPRLMVRFQRHVDSLILADEIEEVSILYGREVGPVVQIVFEGNERGKLAESKRVMADFFAKLGGGRYRELERRRSRTENDNTMMRDQEDLVEVVHELHQVLNYKGTDPHRRRKGSGRVA